MQWAGGEEEEESDATTLKRGGLFTVHRILSAESPTSSSASIASLSTRGERTRDNNGGYWDTQGNQATSVGTHADEEEEEVGGGNFPRYSSTATPSQFCCCCKEYKYSDFFGHFFWY